MAVERHEIPLAFNWSSRFESVDSDGYLVNCMVVTDENGFKWVVKRPGVDVNNAASVGTTSPYGMYYWDAGQNLYSVWGDDIYKGGSLIGTNTMPTNSLQCAFAETDSLLLVQSQNNGTYGDLWTINTSDTITNVSDADFPPNKGTPETLALGVVVIDGYTLVLTTDGVLYNSDVGAPTSWTATNFVNAEMEPDEGVALIKHHNHAAVFGQRSIEFFYNAARPTGSPFQRREDLTVNVGCQDPVSISQVGDIVFFVANEPHGTRFVAMMQNFQYKRISTPAIDRQLDDTSPGTSGSGTGAAFLLDGKLLYALTIPDRSGTSRTWVFDAEENLWYRWTIGTSTAFPINSVAHQSKGGGENIMIHGLAGQAGMANDVTHNFDLGKYVDYKDVGQTTNIAVEIVTPKWNGPAGFAHKPKFMHELNVVGDHDSSNTIDISYSDDDYATFSTPRALKIDPEYKLTQLGSFRERAFKLEHTANGALRLSGLEFAVQVGRR